MGLGCKGSVEQSRRLEVHQHWSQNPYCWVLLKGTALEGKGFGGRHAGENTLRRHMIEFRHINSAFLSRASNVLG